MVKIYPLKLAVSNCFLVQDEGNMLVDTGNSGEGNKIIRFLKQHKLELKDINLILHTHGHSDHCGSTQELLKQANILTAIHEEDKNLAVNGVNGEIKPTRLFAELIKPFVNKPYPPFNPDLVIQNDNFQLQQFGINGTVQETPGHTEGSVSIVFDTGEAIIGDLLMGGYFGGLFLSHQPDYHYFALNMEQVKESLKKTMALPIKKFYVGHGGPLSRESIQKRFPESVR